MKQLRSSALTALGLAALAGIFYSLLPALWLTWVCVAALLFAVLTAIQLQPVPPKQCPHCGYELKQQEEVKR